MRRRHKVALVLLAMAFIGSWALLEYRCGLVKVDAGASGSGQCVRNAMTFPFVAFIGATVALVWALAVPALDTIQDAKLRTGLRVLGWAGVALLLGFSILDAPGIGFFTFWIALIPLAVALRHASSGAWACGAGGVLCVASAVLQAAGFLAAGQSSTSGAIRLSGAGMAVLGLAGAIAFVGAFAWPRAWSLGMFLGATILAWAALAVPGALPETFLLVLPGALLVTIGTIRAFVGWWQAGGARGGSPAAWPR